MKRGEAYVATLLHRSVSEQRGTRPVIIVSHNGFNSTPNWNSIIVIPISTSETLANRGPTAIPLAKGIGGLDKDSVAMCHQVTTLDRAKLTRLMGKIPDHLMVEIGNGIKAALDLTFTKED